MSDPEQAATTQTETAKTEIASWPEVIDREVQYPARVRLQSTTEDGVVDLQAVPGEVTTEGTDVGADLFEAIHNYIDAKDGTKADANYLQQELTRIDGDIDAVEAVANAAVPKSGAALTGALSWAAQGPDMQTFPTPATQTLQNMIYLGQNVTASSANDTRNTWEMYGTGYAYYNEAGRVNGQPKQWGILISIVQGTDIQQEWISLREGTRYKRGVNEESPQAMPTWHRIWDTSSALPVANGGTGLTSNPSMLTNLGSTSAASVLAASPRPGITGTLPVAHGGTGATSASGALSNLGLSPKQLNVQKGNGATGIATLSAWQYGKVVCISAHVDIPAQSSSWANPQILKGAPAPANPAEVFGNAKQNDWNYVHSINALSNGSIGLRLQGGAAPSAGRWIVDIAYIAK